MNLKNMKKRVLVCSSAGNPHIRRLLRVICESQTGVQIDYMSLSYVKDKDLEDIRPYVSNCYILNNYSSKNSLDKLYHQSLSIIKLKKRIENIYDCTIICAITIKYLLLFNTIRKHSKKLIFYPWGSEIIKASKPSLFVLRFFYSKASGVVTIKNSRFENTIRTLLHVNQNKFIDIPYGSELIDMHAISNLSKEDAKKELGLNSDYIITCGYNGYATQNHMLIINSLFSEKELLPTNCHLVFPMTYGLTEEYKFELENTLQRTGFKYTIYTDFMPVERLYALQRATDVFIHIQKTDASSSSVKEFIVAGAKVFNGSWLSYPEIELHGTPYISVKSPELLSESIRNYYCGNIHLDITQEMMDDVKHFTHSNFVMNWQQAIKDWTASSN